MLGNRPMRDWIAQYSSSHQNPVNRACHSVGIPAILASLALAVAAIFIHQLLWWALALFALGWIFQFVGHAFEGKWPEFIYDWRFLFVGARWWLMKVRGKA